MINGTEVFIIVVMTVALICLVLMTVLTVIGFARWNDIVKMMMEELKKE